mmetsp:Transcript_84543/g.217798  ORF Transcript_84543/g.217798 Transcript_84543/m.217798 type:complete len:208 (+) Transcript_84543:665-1288(+)
MRSCTWCQVSACRRCGGHTWRNSEHIAPKCGCRFSVRAFLVSASAKADKFACVSASPVTWPSKQTLLTSRIRAGRFEDASSLCLPLARPTSSMPPSRLSMGTCVALAASSSGRRAARSASRARLAPAGIASIPLSAAARRSFAASLEPFLCWHVLAALSSCSARSAYSSQRCAAAYVSASSLGGQPIWPMWLAKASNACAARLGITA